MKKLLQASAVFCTLLLTNSVFADNPYPTNTYNDTPYSSYNNQSNQYSDKPYGNQPYQSYSSGTAAGTTGSTSTGYLAQTQDSYNEKRLNNAWNSSNDQTYSDSRGSYGSYYDYNNPRGSNQTQGYQGGSQAGYQGGYSQEGNLANDGRGGYGNDRGYQGGYNNDRGYQGGYQGGYSDDRGYQGGYAGGYEGNQGSQGGYDAASQQGSGSSCSQGGCCAAAAPAQQACCPQDCPADQPLNDCWCKYVHYKPCHYNCWKCIEVPQYYTKRCCRMCPKYYQVQRCKMVPQYYCETCCKQCPEYYDVCCSRPCKKYVCEQKCRYVPCYYYKHTCGNSGCSNPCPAKDLPVGAPQ